MLLPSTWALDRLRRAVVDGDASVLLPLLGGDRSDAGVVHVERLMSDLRGLRARFLAAFTAAASDADAVRACNDVFFAAWAAFAAPYSEALRLRPLYGDPAVVGLLRRQLANFVLLERAKARLPGSPGLAGTAHLAVGGSRGVGKSYLLRGLALVVAALGQRVVPVTWSYEEGGALVTHVPTTDDTATAAGTRHLKLVPPSSLLTAAAECIASAAAFETEADYFTRVHDCSEAAVVAESTRAALAPARWGEAAPLLILDEATLLYRDGGDAHHLRGNLAVREVLQVARTPNTAVVLSGSTVQLRDQIFARGRWSGYSSLNSSVFSFEEVHPLRSAEQLSAYLSATGLPLPAHRFPDHAALLSYTGGVGRAIARVCTQGAAGDALLLPLLESPDPGFTLHSDPMFALAVHALLTPHRDALAGAAPYPPPLASPLAAVVGALVRAGDSMGDACARIDAWCDAGLLYREQQPSRAVLTPPAVQLLYPFHARQLWDQMHASGGLLLPLQALVQLHGADGSVGHSLETLMRPHLATLFAGASQRGGKLVERGRALFYSRDDGDPQQFSPSQHLREILVQAAQVGIADFVLYASTGDSEGGNHDGDDAVSDDREGGSILGDDRAGDGDAGGRRCRRGAVVYIDAWQCAAPAVGTVSDWGDLDVATAAIAAARTLPPTLDPISTASHAVAKAMWGFCNLASLLTVANAADAPAPGAPAATAAGARFVPRRLCLLTTAVLSPAAQSSLTDHSLTGYAFPAPLVEACNASLKGRGRALAVGDAARWRLRVTAHDGVGWVERHLPPAVSSRFVTPVLHAREAAARVRAEPRR
jgi:hypothetical protein